MNRISSARGGVAHVRFYPTRLSSPTPQKVEPRQAIVPQLYFPINFKNRTPLLVAIQEEPGGLPTPAVESEESEPAILHSNDSVLLTDGIKCWILRIEDISLLEACFNYTLVHFFDDRLLIRRTLEDCERRLDSSTFFRASRGCIVNLNQVKQPRLCNNGNLIFLLKDGKEVVLSRRQTVLFRATRGL